MKQLALTLLTYVFLSTATGQNYANLKNVLTSELSENSAKDGRWVFYSEKADIQKIDAPLVKAVIPQYDFYKVGLVNYLGSHINDATCLVLFDSVRSNIVLVEPLWYNGISKPLIKLFKKKRFDSKEQMLAFFDQLNGLMEIGSGYKFTKTGMNGDSLTYDLKDWKNDLQITKGIGTSAAVKYNSGDVWRKIRIDLDNLQLMRYTSFNPATNEKEVIK